MRAKTIRGGRRDCVNERYLLRKVGALADALKARGAKRPALAAMAAYASLTGRPGDGYMRRWVAMYRTTRLGPDALNAALDEAGYPERGGER